MTTAARSALLRVTPSHRCHICGRPNWLQCVGRRLDCHLHARRVRPALPQWRMAASRRRSAPRHGRSAGTDSEAYRTASA